MEQLIGGLGGKPLCTRNDLKSDLAQKEHFMTKIINP